MTIHLHRNDLPDGLDLGPVVAIDCETMGLDPRATGCAWCSCRRATAMRIWSRSRRARPRRRTWRGC